MDKAEHGPLLKAAMARHSYSRADVANELGVKVRTVTNWTSGATMPDAGDLERLRRMLGPYDAAGDPVEVAIANSELVDWRQDAVRSVYRRNLHEQRGEAAG